eukprot:jgi/Tetstr1/462526/TSEL_007515.t1
MLPATGPGTVGPWGRFVHAVSRRKSIQEVLAEQAESGAKGRQLRRVVGVWGIIGYGVSSTLGAGLFVVTGKAAHDFAGPAVCVSFALAGLASLLSAACYAELATQIPVAGSAYSFAYVTLGEGAAWLVGWNLVLEYLVSASAVARGWASYLVHLSRVLGAPLPRWAHAIDCRLPLGAGALTLSPLAASAVLLFSALLLGGVSESMRLNLALTAANLGIIAFIIVAGASGLRAENWVPWAPHGASGVVAGAGYVFFSYIGFDSVCTLAEECRHPARDLPVGILGSLAIVSALYVAVSLVITGLVPSASLSAEAPLSQAFAATGMPVASGIVALGSVTALSGTTFCSLLGQPRLFYRMAQDGLLPPAFASVSAATQAPVFGTLFTGATAALLALLFEGDALMDLISIGTLLAFAVVCVCLLVHRTCPAAQAAEAGAPNGHAAARRIAAFCAMCTAFNVGAAQGWPWPALATLGAGALLCIAGLARLEQHCPAGEAAGFVCPTFPAVPCLGAWVNLYLIAGLPSAAFVRLLLWSGVGAAVYGGYSVWHSRVGVSKAL